MLKGVDVSHWNGKIAFDDFVTDTHSDFIIAKITEGWRTLDSMCVDTIEGCRVNSVLYGVYHYMHPGRGRELTTQADWFIDNALSLDVVGNGILALDVEDKSFTAYTRREVSEMVERVVDRIVDRTYVYPIVYSSRSWMPGVYKRVGKDCAGWIASWSDSNRPVRSDLNTSIWQYSNKGRVEGIDANVDMNVFYGSAEAWSRIARGKM